jgi:hypothetical protein
MRTPTTGGLRIKTFELGAVRGTSGDSFRCDLATLVESRLLVQAGSGYGKSWLLRRLLEQTHGSLQQLVLDVEGNFRTLREHFKYVYAATDGGDIPVNPRTARVLAQRLLELNVSAILNLFELKMPERIAFVRHFLEGLIDAPKSSWHPALVVLDEAQVFCPQAGRVESTDAVIDLASRGRGRGFCAVLATQRLAKLNKDAAAEMQNKLIGRAGVDIDAERAGDELGLKPRARTQLRELPIGHFFAMGPAFSTPPGTVIKVGKVKTTHPRPGMVVPPLAVPAEVRSILPQLADLEVDPEPSPASPASNNHEALEAQVVALQRQLVEADEREREAQARLAEVLATSTTPDMSKQLADFEREIKALEEVANRLDAGLRSVRTLGAELRVGLVAAPRTSPPPAPSPVPATTRRPSPAKAAISNPQQRILNAIAWLEAVGLQTSRVLVAFVAGVSPKTAGYGSNVGELRKRGLVSYPRDKFLALTDDGRSAAVVDEELPRAAETLHRLVLDYLSRPLAAIFKIVLEAHPRALSREVIAERVGVSPKTAGFGSNIGALKSLELVVYPAAGQVAAASDLFLSTRGST